MKKKKTLYIVIELKVREFVAKVLFSYFAALRGYRVYLGSREKIFDLILSKKNKGGIFFYKAGLQYDLTKKIDKKVDSHIVLDEEMSPGNSKKSYKYMVNAFLPKTIKYIKYFFYVNSDIVTAFKDYYKLKKNVVASGWPRFDLFRKKFRSLYKSDIKKIKKNYGEFIIFISDFGYISENYESYASEYYSWGVKNDKQLIDGKSRTLRYAKNNYEEFLKVMSFLKNIALKFPKKKIIIRGNPSENLKVWKKEVMNIKNLLFVEPKDDAQPWIEASSGVMHRGCTTSMQAIMLNKPIAFIDLKKKNEFLKKFSHRISFKIKNEKDYFKWINKSKKNINHNLYRKVKKELNIRKKTSCEIILSNLDKLKVKLESTHKFKKNIDNKNFKYFLDKFKSYIYVFFVKTKILKRNIDRLYFYPKLSNGILKQEAVYYLKELRKNILKEINIKQIEVNLIKFEKND